MTPLLTHTLGNGLQIIGHALPDAQSVGVCYYVRTGSRNDEQYPGIAHFLEHMLFRSTKKRSGFELDEAFARIGADVNAETSSDATLYYASAPREHLEQVIALLTEMMEPLLLQEECELEKAVILEELARQEDQPVAHLYTLMKEAYFGPYSSLAHDGLGTRESIQEIKSSHLHAFWKHYYPANNMLLSVAGNFQQEHLLAVAERYAGPLRTGKRMPRDGSSILPIPTTKVAVQPNLQQQHIIVAMPAIPTSDPEYLALLLGSRILDQRLYWSIVHKGLAEEIDTDLWADQYNIFHGAGILSLRTNCFPDLAQVVLKQMQAELGRLLNDGVTTAELRRAKNMRMTGCIIAYEEGMLERAWTLAEQWDYEGRALTIEEELKRIEQVDRKDVMRAFQRFPLIEKQVIVTLGPLQQEDLLNG